MWEPAPETGLSHLWKPSPDTEAVQTIFKKVNEVTAKTVILSINGHYHTNHMGIEDDVLYFDVNTAINGSWIPKKEQHYADKHTFELEHYNDRGEYQSTEVVPLSKLWQSVNTHYFTEPLSAIVTITEDGAIEITGSDTAWCYGVKPENDLDGVMPKISNGLFVVQ